MPDETPQAPPSGGETGAPTPPAGAAPSAHPTPPAGQPPAPDPLSFDLADLDAAAEVERKANPNFKGWSIKPEDLTDPTTRRVAHNLQSDYSRKMAAVAQWQRELDARAAAIKQQAEELDKRRLQIGKTLAAPPDGKPPEGEPPDGFTDPDGRAAWFAKKAAYEVMKEQQEAASKRVQSYETEIAEAREKAQIDAWAEANPEVRTPANQERIVAVINDTTLPLCTPQEAWALLQDDEAFTPQGRAAISKWTSRFQGMTPLEAWKYERSVVRQRPAPEVESHNRALELARPTHARPALRPMPMTSDLAEVRKWQQEGGAAADEAVEELRRTGISA